MVVANLEEIKVPAGQFISAKIEAYNNESGRLMAEYWYAPGAKWSVKRINYGAENGFARLRELRSFKADPGEQTCRPEAAIVFSRTVKWVSGLCPKRNFVSLRVPLPLYE